ncbi:MAG: response regulator transcription factor [bacterium]|nr:response regulator transcription factor [bacterium]
MNDSETVFVIDDDPAVRDSLELLVRSVELPVEAFASGTEFIQSYRPEMSGCVVLDVRMPGLSGIELQEQLSARGSTLPIIFITAHADVPTAVKALKAGAVDFIQKPFSDQDLLDKIHQAFDLDTEKRQAARLRHEIRERMESLTQREREVMALVVEGLTNKVIAHRLELSQRTVEIHRARVMSKMQADSVAQLVRMAMAENEGARLFEPDSSPA